MIGAVHGTVGYEFLNSLLNVFISIDNEHALESTYEAFIGQVVDYESSKRECKGLILDTVLASELHVLAHRLSQIAEISWGIQRLHAKFTAQGTATHCHEFPGL